MSRWPLLPKQVRQLSSLLTTIIVKWQAKPQLKSLMPNASLILIPLHTYTSPQLVWLRKQANEVKRLFFVDLDVARILSQNPIILLPACTYNTKVVQNNFDEMTFRSNQRGIYLSNWFRPIQRKTGRGSTACGKPVVNTPNCSLQGIRT